jgi:Ca-activated chloride channel homolog
MRCWILLVTFCFTQTIHAFSWQDLWKTKDQQAKVMMEEGDFAKAKDTFERPDWQAASAYRAGDYQQAAKLYQSFKQEDAYYNEGNALAHMHQYQQAINAYNQVLATNPNHQDALYNRKIVEELLKKQKQDQDKQNQDKQNQDKQNQDKQNQDKQDQDKQDQDKQDQNKQDQDKQDQDKQDQDKQNQDKSNQNNSEQQSSRSQAQREKDQAKEQWLRLIPDDPGGLLREKFLRDHLRRQSGWTNETP